MGSIGQRLWGVWTRVGPGPGKPPETGKNAGQTPEITCLSLYQ